MGSRPRGQAGFGLVEVLLAVAIFGSAVVVGAGALLLTASRSRGMNYSARTEVALNSFAHGVQLIPYRRPCPLDGVTGTVAHTTRYTSDFRAWAVQAGSATGGVYAAPFAATPASPGFLSTPAALASIGAFDPLRQATAADTATRFEVVEVRYWEASTSSWILAAPSNSRFCSSSSTADRGIQRVKLRVRWGSAASQTKDITIVKRKP